MSEENVPLNEEVIKGQIKESVRSSVEETLTYCDFSSEHWIRIRTSNAIERLNREIRRRTSVVGCFPDGNSALLLADFIRRVCRRICA